MHTVKFLNISVLPINGTLISTTTLGESEPQSNGNERVLHIPQSSRTGASPLDAVSYPGHYRGRKKEGNRYLELKTTYHVYIYIYSAIRRKLKPA